MRWWPVCCRRFLSQRLDPPPHRPAHPPTHPSTFVPTHPPTHPPPRTRRWASCTLGTSSDGRWWGPCSFGLCSTASLAATTPVGGGRWAVVAAPWLGGWWLGGWVAGGTVADWLDGRVSGSESGWPLSRRGRPPPFPPPPALSTRTRPLTLPPFLPMRAQMQRAWTSTAAPASWAMRCCRSWVTPS